VTSELRWRAFGRMSWVWVGWERLYLRLHPVTPVRQGSLFAFRRRRDVLELHLDSWALNRMRETPGYSTFRAVHELRDEIRALAGRFRRAEFPGVTAIEGTSLMGEAGAVLGFEVRPLPRNFGSALQHYFMVGLDAIYNPRGLRARSKRRWPFLTTMTVESLLARYSEVSSTRS
jgi:YkoP-like protein